jgi:hypothetical protein
MIKMILKCQREEVAAEDQAAQKKKFTRILLACLVIFSLNNIKIHQIILKK